jgi:hypothetical protein
MDFSSFFNNNNNNFYYNYDNNYSENKLNNFDLFTNNSLNDEENNLEILNENIFLNKKTNFSYENEDNNLNEIDESTFPSTNLINNNNNNNNNENNHFLKKKYYNLNEEIISLMKQEKTPLNIDFIYNKLKDKKDFFRKKNGSKYKNDFKKSIIYTLRTSGYFNKTYDNKYTYNDDNSIYLIKNKNLNVSNKNYLLPVDIKIQLKKVNNLIKKLHNKYKYDPKYFQVINILDLFRSLLDNFLMLIKYKKNNSIIDLCILNEKIISICYQIEKMEKTEIFNSENDIKIERGKNKNNNVNNINNERNIFLFNGDNNVFTEPPTIF